jgi:hypothetical protein
MAPDLRARQIVQEAATGYATGHEQQQLALVLCELRGVNPWETTNAGGFVMQRWQAALAELRIFAELGR